MYPGILSRAARIVPDSMQAHAICDISGIMWIVCFLAFRPFFQGHALGKALFFGFAFNPVKEIRICRTSKGTFQFGNAAAKDLENQIIKEPASIERIAAIDERVHTIQNCKVASAASEIQDNSTAFQVVYVQRSGLEAGNKGCVRLAHKDG